MDIPIPELWSVVRKYNPWWESRSDADLPNWRRVAFGELYRWLHDPPAQRAVLVSGARQVGKTTLLRQAAYQLIADGVEPSNILYVTFDSPLIKLIGLEGLIKAWEEFRPENQQPEYLLLDEIQYTKEWQTWLKHQVDFHKRRRIVVTGSAMPLSTEQQESGVGRWHTIKLPTLSFHEYLQLKKVDAPEIPAVESLTHTFRYNDFERSNISARAKWLTPHFHDYLLRGGFPQTALVANVDLAQTLLREDIVDKVLKRDMTAHFGTRRILELDRLFLFLCLHDGGILNLATLSENLEVGKKTIQHYLELFEAANLIYRLPRYGYGKEILRANYKVYLADAAISSSVLLRGNSLLDDPAKLGAAVETAFFKHLYSRYYSQNLHFSYWRAKSKLEYEVDIVVEMPELLVPFEIKYSQQRVGAGEVKGLQMFCTEKKLPRGYVITRDMDDFGLLTQHNAPAELMKIPAALACYWLSRSETSERVA